MIKHIETDNAPAAIGPYSQAIQVDKTIYLSGQLPIEAKSGKMSQNIKEQTIQSMLNIEAILEEVDYKLEDVIHCTIYLNNMDNFLEMNEAYGSFFKEKYPTRSCIAVKEIPKNALVEIEAIAVK